MIISFVLVEPKVPENIGASARAIKTMGFTDLVLVNPSNWKNDKARWVAHGSSDVLEKALLFKSLEESVGSSDFVIATSAKQRSVKQDYVSIRELKSFLLRKGKSINKVSVIFGREESGLTNDEIKLCDIVSNIKLASLYPSLNLAQAVMLFAYELSDLRNIESESEPGVTDYMSVRMLKQKIGSLLKIIGIEDGDNIHGRIMERMAFIGDEDINLLHSISTMLEKRLTS